VKCEIEGAWYRHLGCANLIEKLNMIYTCTLAFYCLIPSNITQFVYYLIYFFTTHLKILLGGYFQGKKKSLQSLFEIIAD